MRPRPEGRGELHRLQAVLPAAIALQCGHDPKAVENAIITGFNGGGVNGASMRPRPEGRGEPQSLVQVEADLGASMRPRPEGRGEPPLHDLKDVAEQLQCGHDPKAVENEGTPQRAAAPPELQCGHDPKAVENEIPDQFLASLLSGFNAATTRRPWRTVAAFRAGRAGRGASMRPRPEGRGELNIRNRKTGSHASFNAATTRRPWRTHGDGRPQDGRPHQASMRPRPEGRGERDAVGTH